MKDEQAEYKKFVIGYFHEQGIELTKDTGYFFTPVYKETDRFYTEYAKKVNGKYIPSGIMLKPKYYFVGDYSIGLYHYSAFFEKYILGGAYESRDLGIYKCSVNYKSQVMTNAIFVTKFYRRSKDHG